MDLLSVLPEVCMNSNVRPYFKGDRVNAYNQLINFVEALYYQRKYLSRTETIIQCVSDDHYNSTMDVISVLSNNRKVDGLYRIAS